MLHARSIAPSLNNKQAYKDQTLREGGNWRDVGKQRVWRKVDGRGCEIKREKCFYQNSKSWGRCRNRKSHINLRHYMHHISSRHKEGTVPRRQEGTRVLHSAPHTGTRSGLNMSVPEHRGWWLMVACPLCCTEHQHIPTPFYWTNAHQPHR